MDFNQVALLLHVVHQSMNVPEAAEFRAEALDELRKMGAELTKERAERKKADKKELAEKEVEVKKETPVDDRPNPFRR